MRGVFGLALVLVAGGVLWYALSPASFQQAIGQVKGKLPTSAAGGATRNGG